jgi:hypothetical protein
MIYYLRPETHEKSPWQLFCVLAISALRPSTSSKAATMALAIISSDNAGNCLYCAQIYFLIIRLVTDGISGFHAGAIDCV